MPHIARSPLRLALDTQGLLKKAHDYPLRISRAAAWTGRCPRTTCQLILRSHFFLCPKTSMPSNATPIGRTGTGLHPLAHPITAFSACRRVTLAQPIFALCGAVTRHQSRRQIVGRNKVDIALGKQFLPSKACSFVFPGQRAESSHERLTGAIPNHQPTRLNLVEAAALLGHAHAVIGVDTGLSHLAAAAQPCHIASTPLTIPGLTGLHAENWLSILGANKNPHS